MKIPIDAITIDRQLLRRALDPEALAALAADFVENGQIQPIAVERTGPASWRLVAGRRRLHAAKLLDWTDIEAHEIVVKSLAEIPALAENLKRSQLSPLEEADTVHWMHTEGQMSINDIADRTGHGNNWVQDRLELANMPENVKDAVHRRKISIGAAGMLCRITQLDYRDYLLHIAVTNGATVHQAESWWLDWTARMRMQGDTGNGLPIPQPPPAPPPPRQPCFGCDQQTDAEMIVLLRFCRACMNELQDAKRPVPCPASPDGFE